MTVTKRIPFVRKGGWGKMFMKEDFPEPGFVVNGGGRVDFKLRPCDSGSERGTTYHA